MGFEIDIAFVVKLVINKKYVSFQAN